MMNTVVEPILFPHGEADAVYQNPVISSVLDLMVTLECSVYFARI